MRQTALQDESLFETEEFPLNPSDVPFVDQEFDEPDDSCLDVFLEDQHDLSLLN